MDKIKTEMADVQTIGMGEIKTEIMAGMSAASSARAAHG